MKLYRVPFPQDIQQYFKDTLAQNTIFGQSLIIDDIIDANLNRSIIFDQILALFERYDVLACPTVGCMPHLVSEEWVRSVGGVELTGYMDWLWFAFFSHDHGPSCNICTGWIGTARFARGVTVDRQAAWRSGALSSSAPS